MAEGNKNLINRRQLMVLSGAALCSTALPVRGQAQDGAKTALHGLAVFDDLKYPAGFSHFDYINPQAPKGGTFRFTVNEWALNQAPNTFNTLNTFSALGDAPPRMETCFDSLMTPALDEPDAVYGLLAESVTVSADGNSFLFKLREQARFHDDTPVTAHDAAFSYALLKEKGTLPCDYCSLKWKLRLPKMIIICGSLSKLKRPGKTAVSSAIWLRFRCSLKPITRRIVLMETV